MTAASPTAPSSIKPGTRCYHIIEAAGMRAVYEVTVVKFKAGRYRLRHTYWDGMRVETEFWTHTRDAPTDREIITPMAFIHSEEA